ncbi:MAG: hypothetical protein FWE68_01135 [Defluviitaleaceae bacterium]|nr:hypothetical protein [Defluviitaleaceae bacterium]
MVEKSVVKSIEQAKRGRELWLELVKRHNIANGDYVILFPATSAMDDEWNRYGALYLDAFLDANNSNRALALCCDEKTAACVTRHSKKAEPIAVSREDSENLTALYNLYMFTNNLIIFSPDEPTGRRGSAIAGKKEITFEEVAAIGVYGLKPGFREGRNLCANPLEVL